MTPERKEERKGRRVKQARDERKDEGRNWLLMDKHARTGNRY